MKIEQLYVSDKASQFNKIKETQLCVLWNPLQPDPHYYFISDVKRLSQEQFNQLKELTFTPAQDDYFFDNPRFAPHMIYEPLSDNSIFFNAKHGAIEIVTWRELATKLKDFADAVINRKDNDFRD